MRLNPGNKANNNEEGVFPDDTLAAFDNPRIEYLSQYLHMLQGKSLGVVTTADVFDATPAANAVHTALRGNGTGIVDQFLDERDKTGLTVLLGGGRKWFLPNVGGATSPQPGNGSQRSARTDYVLPSDVINGWGVAPGKLDPERDLIGDFIGAGFAYAPDNSALNQAFARDVPDKLLGLFAYGNMNVALDKLAKRRNTLLPRRAIERLGAKQDGILRNHQIAPNGTLRDTVVYSILPGEWPTVKAHLTYQLDEKPR